MFELDARAEVSPELRYDYSSYDPEDDLYGDYAAEPSRFNSEGFQVGRWGTRGKELWPSDQEGSCTAGHPSDAEEPNVADARRSDFAVEPGSGASALIEILQTWDGQGRPAVPRAVRHQLGREVLSRGPGANLAAGHKVTAFVLAHPSVIPRKVRRWMLKTVKPTTSAPPETWFAVRLLFTDKRFADAAFARFWRADITDDVRAQLALWAIAAGIGRVKAAPVVDQALASLSRVSALNSEAAVADNVFAYLTAVAPYADLGRWMICLVKWAIDTPNQLSDRSSRLWHALAAWWATNEYRLTPTHFAPVIEEREIPTVVRAWAIERYRRLALGRAKATLP